MTRKRQHNKKQENTWKSNSQKTKSKLQENMFKFIGCQGMKIRVTKSYHFIPSILATI